MAHFHLIGSEISSLRGEPEPEDVVFYVHVTSDEQPAEAVYRLDVMTQREYDGWYLDRHFDSEPPAEEEVFPLVVPDTVLVDGLVNHVLHTYLDPTQPERINDISRFLDGPITPAENGSN